MMTTDMHKHAPQTPNEMIDLNYTFYLPSDTPFTTEINPKITSFIKNYKRYKKINSKQI